MKNPHRYDDMLDLKHHQSSRHPQMSQYNRAAQFSPFAALTGYEDCINETGRLTQERIYLDDQTREELDQKFLMITRHLQDHQEVKFTYFQPDLQKEGGSYQQITGIVKRILPNERQLILYAPNGISDGRTLEIDQIFDITTSWKLMN